MDKRVKYICINDDRFDCIIVFSKLLSHDIFINLKPKSAGFISFENGEATCYGESVSLRIKSNPEYDSELANKQILIK